MAGGAAIPWRYPDRPRLAPGTPGAEPHWAPPAKDDVGMALGPGGYPANRVWFTIGLYVVLAPHLGNRGAGNTAWLGEHRGTPMLFAKRAGRALALACSAGWLKGSAGYVGVSDGWQDLARHKRIKCEYDRADDGNVALVREIDLRTCGGSGVTGCNPLDRRWLANEPRE
jgi:Glucodextranase, domain N